MNLYAELSMVGTTSREHSSAYLVQSGDLKGCPNFFIAAPGLVAPDWIILLGGCDHSGSRNVTLKGHGYRKFPAPYNSALYTGRAFRSVNGVPTKLSFPTALIAIKKLWI